MTNPETGLTKKEVQKLRKKHGYNHIKTKKEFTALKIFLSQFTSFLIIILIIAGSISIILAEYIDGIAIFGIVVINALIGFFQEYKAENAVKALKKMVIPIAVVIREGVEEEISIEELVPGDIVILAEGDKIPADLEIVESFSLRADEAILTGESVPVNKKKSKEHEGLLFKGTLITTGRAKAEVIHTGMKTEFGKIVGLLAKEEKTRSPLAIQLDQLGKKLGVVILILIFFLFILGTIRKIDLFDMLMTSVALGVSAIPEGMPIIVTLTLAMGVQILAKKKAIVRKMNSIETLGATTVICSDKTGTLTLNEMTVKKIYTDFKEKKIPGQGYSIEDKVEFT
ncbi:HAD-IC family P-type ATPase, partial [Patescibacteria group bacterium]